MSTQLYRSFYGAAAKYHLLPTESKFNPEPTDKDLVMLRLANGDKVKTNSEQEAAMIDKCVERKKR